MKRILAFDGGGIRGLFSLQVAARVEALLRDAYGRSDLVLADVVDLFAGTSTGAIIAACLAWGAPVEDVERLYLDHARAMFVRQPILGRLKAKYRADSLATVFRSYFAEADGSPALLGSPRLKKLLLVVMRNASTGSPWPISSNPYAAFNDLSRPDSNLRIPLWQLLRASTAAPLYFPPEEIAVGSQRFLFVPPPSPLVTEWLEFLGITGPLGASAMGVLLISDESSRRDERFAETRRTLEMLLPRLRQASTWDSLNRVVTEIEEQLVRELLEWRSFVRNTESIH
jgi:hypothetical protein